MRVKDKPELSGGDRAYADDADAFSIGSTNIDGFD